MATEAQKYVAAHGAPAESSSSSSVASEYVTQLGHWDGQGTLAPYAALEPKLTQKYRLWGEECVVVGCKRKIDTPKFVMELIGAPACMECAQKIALQQTKGGAAADRFDFAYEKPTPQEIDKCRAAGVTMPAYGE
eukprot:CAMPEP_0118906992 /NCGR_PEP_ID=MMETSP1166-20130328/10643_1 /TAXON_ID=1104430 /ORGANISM="Chrysoreinhardia sp, Strain CCMP3193" /LENGTH=134 /DNA_ID=CAMNT_0006846349 /DNA_START=21 /DNA_END=425 /DNA_ORIENTATION=+